MRLAKRTASPVPLYFKVMMRIRDDILSGTWSHCDRLPGEIELARQLGVNETGTTVLVLGVYLGRAWWKRAWFRYCR